MCHDRPLPKESRLRNWGEHGCGFAFCRRDGSGEVPPQSSSAGGALAPKSTGVIMLVMNPGVWKKLATDKFTIGAMPPPQLGR
jgi:hypothetical protein